MAGKEVVGSDVGKAGVAPSPLSPPLTVERPIGSRRWSFHETPHSVSVENFEGSFLEFTGEAQLLGAGYRTSTGTIGTSINWGANVPKARFRFERGLMQPVMERRAFMTELTLGEDLREEPDDAADDWADLAGEQERALREGRRELEAMIAETGEVRASFQGATQRMAHLREEAVKAEGRLMEARTSLRDVRQSVDNLESEHERLLKERNDPKLVEANAARCKSLQDEVDRLKEGRRHMTELARARLCEAKAKTSAAEETVRVREDQNRDLEREKVRLLEDMSKRESCHSLEVSDTVNAYERQVERLRLERERILDQMQEDEIVRQRDVMHEAERRAAREKEHQETLNDLLKTQTTQAETAEKSRLEAEQAEMSRAIQMSKDAESVRQTQLRDLERANLELKQSAEEARQRDIDRIAQEVRLEREQVESLRKAKDSAVARAQLDHSGGREGSRQRVDSRTTLDPEYDLTEYVGTLHSEAVYLSSLEKTGRLSIADEARLRLLVSELAEIKREKQMADVSRLSKQVDEVSRGYPTNKQNPRATSLMNVPSAQPLRRVIDVFDDSYRDGSSMRGNPPTYQDVRTSVYSQNDRTSGGLAGGHLRSVSSIPDHRRTLGMDYGTRNMAQERAADRVRRSSMLVETPCMTPARRRYIETQPFDGKTDWVTWYGYHCEDCKINGCTEREAFASLKKNLRTGPAKDTLWLFEDQGDGSMRMLVEMVTDAMVSNQQDPILKLERRRQGKLEGVKSFGFALKRLACEAYPGVNFDVEWLITKINGLFIGGLYDPELVSDMSREWRTWMSLRELMDLAEELIRKRQLIPSLLNRGVTAGRVNGVEELDTQSECSEQNDAEVAAFDGKYKSGKSRNTPTAGKAGKGGKTSGKTSKPDKSKLSMEEIQEMLLTLDEFVRKGRARSGVQTPTDARCFGCHKKGHFERDCPAVKDKTTKKKSEN